MNLATTLYQASEDWQLRAVHTAIDLETSKQILAEEAFIPGLSPEDMVYFLAHTDPHYDPDPDIFRAWVEAQGEGTQTLYIEGDDSYAGNYIPTTSRTWVFGDSVFVLHTQPDWDNYQEDWFLTLNGKIIAEHSH